MNNKCGYIGINGGEVYYELSGNPVGKPLLMLHGGLGSLDELIHIQKYVAVDYQLISIDFRGHGRSPLGSRPLSYLQYQQDIQDVLGHFSIDRYSIFGFSDGGIVGYRLAALDPGSVSCLVTLGAAWRLEPNEPSLELKSSLTEDFWVSKFPDDIALYESSNPKPDFSKLVGAVKAVWLDTTPSGYPCNLVERIRCPTLIMRGDNDILFSLDEAVSLKAKITGSSFANIPLAAHSAHQDSPELVGKILQQFISQ